MIITSLCICIWKIVHFYNRIIHATTYRLQAMAYNAKVLSSQEKAMDEYLRRQRANAEQHIHQMYQSPYSAAEAARHRAAAGTSKEIGSTSGGFVRLQEPTTAKMPLTGIIPSSTPATPTGRRRNLPQSNHRNGSPSRYVYPFNLYLY